MNVKTPPKMSGSVISLAWVEVVLAFVPGKDSNARIHLGVINASVPLDISWI